MKLFLIRRFFLMATGILLSVHVASAMRPTWARKAVSFPSECEVDSSVGPNSGSPQTAFTPHPGTAACKPIRIQSPDKNLTVEIYYQKIEIEKGFSKLVAYFQLRSQNGTGRDASFPVGFQHIDLLWSPDSKAFFVNGGNGGGYWGFWVYVYRVDDPELQPLTITDKAQRDMVKTFPPCKASQLDRQTCLEMEKEPDFNMSGIDWTEDSSSVVVMAEVPCSGRSGGIMCQVMGYELSVPDGGIVQRMNSNEFAKTWQKSMAWRFKDPGPPEYCDAKNRHTVFGCENHDW